VILGTFAGSLSLVNELFMSYKELTWAYNIGKFQFDFKKLLKSEKNSLLRCMLQRGSSSGAEYHQKYEFSRKKLFPQNDQGRGAIE